MGPDDGATGRTGVTSQAAVAACAGMALFYVAILYAPMLVLRLPPPTSVESFLIRRFVCAIVSSIASVVLSSALLGVRSFEHISTIFNIHGIRGDHMWQAVAYPVLLTSLPYMGTFASKLLRTVPTRMSGKSGYDAFSCRSLKERTASLTSNVMAWRNYVMAPITEELVFRASMIPLLLCGGFRIHNVIFFTPIFFSLAHLNHLFELYYWQNLSFVRAFMVVGFQLCYTVIFGSYAAFLFIRTGNLASPLVAHVFCNVMGLPALSSSHSKVYQAISSMGGGAIGLTTPTKYSSWLYQLEQKYLHLINSCSVIFSHILTNCLKGPASLTNLFLIICSDSECSIHCWCDSIFLPSIPSH